MRVGLGLGSGFELGLGGGLCPINQSKNVMNQSVMAEDNLDLAFQSNVAFFLHPSI